MFWSVGWPLLWAGGFFCNLDILYGGLGIGKLQFLISRKKFTFFRSCYFFFNFWPLKPWIRIGSGSVSGSVLASIRILWIRIRKKWIRIRNPENRRLWSCHQSRQRTAREHFLRHPSLHGSRGKLLHRKLAFLLLNFIFHRLTIQIFLISTLGTQIIE